MLISASKKHNFLKTPNVIAYLPGKSIILLSF
jgi:hypothetical protein